MNPRDAKALLTSHRALLQGHFLLSSGRHSDRYLQCAVALQHPTVAEKLGAALAKRCKSRLGNRITGVVSPALGGVIIGHELGRALGCPAAFTERVDGKMCLRRGFDIEGEQALLVEDVITTGLSSRETLAVMRAAGATPLAVACIANRSGGSELDGLPLIALIDLDVPTWDAARCPLCAAGDAPVKPGSRGT